MGGRPRGRTATAAASQRQPCHASGRSGEGDGRPVIFESCPLLRRLAGRNGTLYLVLANSLPTPRPAADLAVAGRPRARAARRSARPARPRRGHRLDVRRSRPAWTPTAASRSPQTITFTGAVPAELSQKFETREDLVGDRQYVQDDQRRHRHGRRGHASPRTIDEDGRFTTVTVPTNGATEVVISYTVTGAVVNIRDGTALRVRLLQGLSAQVAEFTATVQIPAQFSYIKCTAGNPNSTDPVHLRRGRAPRRRRCPTFRDGPRGEGQVVAVDIGFPPGTVAGQRADRLPLDRRPGVLGPAAAARPGPGPAGAGRDRPVPAASPDRDRRQRGRPGQPGRRVRPDRRRAERVPGGRGHPARARRHGGRRAGRPDRRHRHPGRPRRTRAPDRSPSCRGRASSPGPTGS